MKWTAVFLYPSALFWVRWRAENQYKYNVFIADEELKRYIHTAIIVCFLVEMGSPGSNIRIYLYFYIQVALSIFFKRRALPVGRPLFASHAAY